MLPKYCRTVVSPKDPSPLRGEREKKTRAWRCLQAFLPLALEGRGVLTRYKSSEGFEQNAHEES